MADDQQVKDDLINFHQDCVKLSRGVREYYTKKAASGVRELNGLALELIKSEGEVDNRPWQLKLPVVGMTKEAIYKELLALKREREAQEDGRQKIVLKEFKHIQIIGRYTKNGALNERGIKVMQGNSDGMPFWESATKNDIQAILKAYLENESNRKIITSRDKRRHLYNDYYNLKKVVEDWVLDPNISATPEERYLNQKNAIEYVDLLMRQGLHSEIYRDYGGGKTILGKACLDSFDGLVELILNQPANFLFWGKGYGLSLDDLGVVLRKTNNEYKNRYGNEAVSMKEAKEKFEKLEEEAKKKPQQEEQKEEPQEEEKKDKEKEAKEQKEKARLRAQRGKEFNAYCHRRRARQIIVTLRCRQKLAEKRYGRLQKRGFWSTFFEKAKLLVVLSKQQMLDLSDELAANFQVYYKRSLGITTQDLECGEALAENKIELKKLLTDKFTKRSKMYKDMTLTNLVLGFIWRDFTAGPIGPNYWLEKEKVIKWDKADVVTVEIYKSAYAVSKHLKRLAKDLFFTDDELNNTPKSMRFRLSNLKKAGWRRIAAGLYEIIAAHISQQLDRKLKDSKDFQGVGLFETRRGKVEEYYKRLLECVDIIARLKEAGTACKGEFYSGELLTEDLYRLDTMRKGRTNDAYDETLKALCQLNAPQVLKKYLAKLQYAGLLGTIFSKDTAKGRARAKQLLYMAYKEGHTEIIDILEEDKTSKYKHYFWASQKPSDDLVQSLVDLCKNPKHAEHAKRGTWITLLYKLYKVIAPVRSFEEWLADKEIKIADFNSWKRGKDALEAIQKKFKFYKKPEKAKKDNDEKDVNGRKSFYDRQLEISSIFKLVEAKNENELKKRIWKGQPATHTYEIIAYLAGAVGLRGVIETLQLEYLSSIFTGTDKLLLLKEMKEDPENKGGATGYSGFQGLLENGYYKEVDKLLGGITRKDQKQFKDWLCWPWLFAQYKAAKRAKPSDLAFNKVILTTLQYYLSSIDKALCKLESEKDSIAAIRTIICDERWCVNSGRDVLQDIFFDPLALNVLVGNGNEQKQAEKKETALSQRHSLFEFLIRQGRTKTLYFLRDECKFFDGIFNKDYSWEHCQATIWTTLTDPSEDNPADSRINKEHVAALVKWFFTHPSWGKDTNGRDAFFTNKLNKLAEKIKAESVGLGDQHLAVLKKLKIEIKVQLAVASQEKAGVDAKEEEKSEKALEVATEIEKEIKIKDGSLKKQALFTALSNVRRASQRYQYDTFKTELTRFTGLWNKHIVAYINDTLKKKALLPAYKDTVNSSAERDRYGRFLLATGSNGGNLLHSLCGSSAEPWLESLKKLLPYRAQTVLIDAFSVKNGGGLTPILVAIRNERYKTVRYLLVDLLSSKNPSLKALSQQLLTVEVLQALTGWAADEDSKAQLKTLCKELVPRLKAMVKNENNNADAMKVAAKLFALQLEHMDKGALETLMDDLFQENKGKKLLTAEVFKALKGWANDDTHASKLKQLCQRQLKPLLDEAIEAIKTEASKPTQTVSKNDIKVIAEHLSLHVKAGSMDENEGKRLTADLLNVVLDKCPPAFFKGLHDKYPTLRFRPRDYPWFTCTDESFKKSYVQVMRLYYLGKDLSVKNLNKLIPKEEEEKTEIDAADDNTHEAKEEKQKEENHKEPVAGLEKHLLWGDIDGILDFYLAQRDKWEEAGGKDLFGRYNRRNDWYEHELPLDEYERYEGIFLNTYKALIYRGCTDLLLTKSVLDIRDHFRRCFKPKTENFDLEVWNAKYSQAQYDAYLKFDKQGNKQAAFACLMSAARQGHKDAQYAYAYRTLLSEYEWEEEKKDEPKNEEKKDAQEKEAVEFLKQAAEQGHTQAETLYGMLHLHAFKLENIEENDQAACDWLTKAAEKGDAMAEFWLGWMYRIGRVKSADQAKIGIEWHKKSAEHVNFLGQYYVMCYYAGSSSKQEQASEQFEKYEVLLKKPAESDEQKEADKLAFAYEYKRYKKNNDSVAPLIIAKMYLYGRGVTQSKDQAIKWCKTSATMGSADAKFELGLIYYKKKKYKLACQWLNQLITGDREVRAWKVAETYFMLAEMYWKGKHKDNQACGINQNKKEALSLYKQGYMILKKLGKSKKTAEWLDTASQAFTGDNNPDAQLLRGEMCYGAVINDRVEAFLWFWVAAKKREVAKDKLLKCLDLNNASAQAVNEFIGKLFARIKNLNDNNKSPFMNARKLTALKNELLRRLTETGDWKLFYRVIQANPSLQQLATKDLPWYSNAKFELVNEQTEEKVEKTDKTTQPGKQACTALIYHMITASKETDEITAVKSSVQDFINANEEQKKSYDKWLENPLKMGRVNAMEMLYHGVLLADIRFIQSAAEPFRSKDVFWGYWLSLEEYQDFERLFTQRIVALKQVEAPEQAITQLKAARACFRKNFKVTENAKGKNKWGQLNDAGYFVGTYTRFPKYRPTLDCLDYINENLLKSKQKNLQNGTALNEFCHQLYTLDGENKPYRSAKEQEAAVNKLLQKLVRLPSATLLEALKYKNADGLTPTELAKEQEQKFEKETGQKPQIILSFILEKLQNELKAICEEEKQADNFIAKTNIQRMRLGDFSSIKANRVCHLKALYYACYYNRDYFIKRILSPNAFEGEGRIRSADGCKLSGRKKERSIGMQWNTVARYFDPGEERDDFFKIYNLLAKNKALRSIVNEAVLERLADTSKPLSLHTLALIYFTDRGMSKKTYSPLLQANWALLKRFSYYHSSDEKYILEVKACLYYIYFTRRLDGCAFFMSKLLAGCKVEAIKNKLPKVFEKVRQIIENNERNREGSWFNQLYAALNKKTLDIKCLEDLVGQSLENAKLVNAKLLARKDLRAKEVRDFLTSLDKIIANSKETPDAVQEPEKEAKEDIVIDDNKKVVLNKDLIIPVVKGQQGVLSTADLQENVEKDGIHVDNTLIVDDSNKQLQSTMTNQVVE